ncbi:cAMP-responsive element modulator-like isoform X2 [Hippocampus comes]|uniref:cAMP-responsive element modulator-like isoform X2 n=1 Tax=Hippocampus comes TaxID=109280 RepID=UPI00094EED1F|nr:PREDICTED: cAMP-responsive element modulator-like isoform X2 [Hippocampus comes]XP_051910158.1 cAMP-responsive element modulator-like isoform X2 [Hippocampus zosterae]
MDPPQSHTLNTEGAQTLTAMTTINPQTLAPESNAFGYYQNMWNHPNNYFPSIQGDMTATQLQYANSILPQGVAQGSGPRNQSERSLMKNREAAREYRRRRKAYVQGLEERVAKLENQNKALKEELKTWKEMCHHNGP